MTIARVKKRDGRMVPFDETKIRDAIQRAMLAVGEGDLGFAGEVAGVVRLALESRRASLEGSADDQTPGIEEIQDLVEHALIQLGRASVAKAYILYRDRRAKVREVLEVHRSPKPGVRVPRVRTSDEGAPAAWSKGRIVAALMSEAELARHTAEDVAGRVEARVFALGQQRISTALVRELVDSELASLGLDAALHRQASVLLPVHDLKRQLESPARPLDESRPATAEELGDAEVSRRLSGELLRRFALDHVLDESSLERHLGGDFAVVDLSAPHLYLWAGLPAELFPEHGEGEAAAFALLGECARALQSVSQGVVLENAERALAPLAGAGRGRAGKRGSGLAHWMRAAAATAQASGRRIELSLAAEKSGEFLERALEALASVEGLAAAPRLFVDERILESLLGASLGDAARAQVLDRALERGQVVPTWGRDGERFAAPGAQRGARERAAVYCAGAVALNLPRLALRAGPWREDRLLESLAGAVEAALLALARLQEFQAATRGSRPHELRGRLVYGLAPVGLREALQVLGDGEIRPEQGARLLGFLGDAARRFSQARGLALVPTPFFGERAAARFAEADAELPQLHQRLMFAEGGPVEPGRPYSSGLRISPAPGFVPWAAEARMLTTLAVGALHPLPEERSRGGMLSLAESAVRFFRLRREGGAGDPDATPGPATSTALPAAPRDGAGLFDETTSPARERVFPDASRPPPPALPS